MLLKKSKMFVSAVMLLAMLLTAGMAGAESVSPTTGLPYEGPYRPVLVTIHNTNDTRPQWGLEDADIVYETIYWAPGHTRYLALFNDKHPSGVGPVRGARVYDVDIARGWDAPHAHSGGQIDEGTNFQHAHAAYGVDKQFILDAVYSTHDARIMNLFTFKEGRVAPHNRSFKAEVFVQTLWPAFEGVPYEPRLPKLQFSQTPTVGDERGNTVAIYYDQPYYDVIEVATGEAVHMLDSLHMDEFAYSEENARYERYEDGVLTHVLLTDLLWGAEYQPTFEYNRETEQYDRSYNGLAQLGESGAQLTAANVIVQYVQLSFYEDIAARPMIATTGGGRADIYVRGSRVQAHWLRETVEDAIAFYDDAGEPIVLAPGKTFIQMIPLEFACIVEPSEEGSYRYARQ